MVSRKRAAGQARREARAAIDALENGRCMHGLLRSMTSVRGNKIKRISNTSNSVLATVNPKEMGIEECAVRSMNKVVQVHPEVLTDDITKADVLACFLHMGAVAMLPFDFDLLYESDTNIARMMTGKILAALYLLLHHHKGEYNQ
jgi:hypothetical protein